MVHPQDANADVFQLFFNELSITGRCKMLSVSGDLMPEAVMPRIPAAQRRY
jgi:hypothetical protein